MTSRSRVMDVAKALVLPFLLIACSSAPAPAPDSPEYEEAVTAFYTGVAAIQVGEDERATRSLTRVAELAPREPAAAANLAILALQQRRLDDAAALVDRALSEASGEPRIRVLAALIERARGNLDEAIDHASRVTDGSAVRARFLLAQLLEQRDAPGDATESRRVLDELVELHGSNTFLAVASARHAARQGDGDALERALTHLEVLAGPWLAPERAALDRVRASIGQPADAGAELTMLAASLDATPAYARERDAIVLSEQRPDVVVTEFILLPSPSAQPPEPDLGMLFVARSLDSLPEPVLDVEPVWNGEGETRVAVMGAGGLWILGDSGAVQHVPLAPGAAVAIASFDFDHDFRVDLAVAGHGGLRLFRQEADGRFIATDARTLPERTRSRALSGVWAADTDVDGDVDLVLASATDAPFVLRNHGDGTFSEQPTQFDGVAGVRDFVWGDLDDDGVADAAFLDDGGRVHVFSNPRQDQPLFVRHEVPSNLSDVRAIALGDLTADGRFELFALRADGALIHASNSGAGWRAQEIARWEDFAADAPRTRLLIADMDNNGVIDVAGSAHRTQIWLADAGRELVAHETLPMVATAAMDLTGSGRIELVGMDGRRQPVRMTSRSTLDYYGLTISPRATSEAGDRRINTFGVGGEAEVRAGMLYQKQPISSPVVHFGLGRNTGVAVARILWPNGTAQAEFDLLASQGGEPIVAEQRLKGSCPWLFAHDGSAMRFVTDVAWRTALGLRINSYGSSSVIHSEDRVRIRADQLEPRDGFYELSITGELWESHFFDHIALMVVDHPADTEVFIDERFARPPPDSELRVTATLSPVARAWDDRGRDVTALIAARDERYADTFELGEFQGIARRKHHLEIDLGPGAATDSALLLVAHGWVQPTDGSINYALGQGDHALPHGLRVEVPDHNGGWSVLHADLGMPAGKTKNVLIDLAGAFQPDTPRRVRLSTNMEIYWDHVAWTIARPDAEPRVVRLLPDHADLRFRGFSKLRRAGRRAPELPEYIVAGTSPIWADLEGHHTRFGDVLPLLEEVDDRYAIMNAGDELQLRFAAPDEPENGWVRDYVFVSDAWVKDGDFNNGFSSTLMPLPYHGLDDYSRPPRRLQDDPAFQRHPKDWVDYHTRYVTRTAFRHALSRD